MEHNYELIHPGDIYTCVVKNPRYRVDYHILSKFKEGDDIIVIKVLPNECLILPFVTRENSSGFESNRKKFWYNNIQPYKIEKDILTDARFFELKPTRLTRNELKTFKDTVMGQQQQQNKSKTNTNIQMESVFNRIKLLEAEAEDADKLLKDEADDNKKCECKTEQCKCKTGKKIDEGKTVKIGATDLVNKLKPGIRVTIKTKQDQNYSGTVSIKSKNHSVLNMGGRHGTPKVADENNIVSATIDGVKYIVENKINKTNKGK